MFQEVSLRGESGRIKELDATFKLLDVACVCLVG
jgi:hypothetical protein